MPITVAVRFKLVRNPGGGEQSAVDELQRLTYLVREALLLDRSRGGNAEFLTWGGGFIRGTEVDGSSALVSAVPNQAFYTGTIPVITSWVQHR